MESTKFEFKTLPTTVYQFLGTQWKKGIDGTLVMSPAEAD